MRFQNTNEAPRGRLQEIAMFLYCEGGFWELFPQGETSQKV
jgi:hypothetical protein